LWSHLVKGLQRNFIRNKGCVQKDRLWSRAGIIRMLDLRRSIYKQTAAHGHFGRNGLDLP